MPRATLPGHSAVVPTTIWRTWFIGFDSSRRLFPRHLRSLRKINAARTFSAQCQADGRYMVYLPVKELLPDLTETHRLVESFSAWSGVSLETLETLQQLYEEFPKTYEELNHMAPINSDNSAKERVCYLPHHGVLRPISSTKLRVVFNGSTFTTAGDCLNRHLLVGSNLLPPLTDVLLRWRRYRYCLTTDVEKMYCQVLVYTNDRDLQRILWRPEGRADVCEYRRILHTVTYGLACAPFLAIRTLHQLAEDERERYPVMQRDVYMDDILTGSATLAEAKELQKQLIALCTSGGFPIRKWASNSPELLEIIPAEHRMQLETRDGRLSATLTPLSGCSGTPQRTTFLLRRGTSPLE